MGGEGKMVEADETYIGGKAGRAKPGALITTSRLSCLWWSAMPVACRTRSAFKRPQKASKASILLICGLTGGPKPLRWGNAKLRRLLASLLDC